MRVAVLMLSYNRYELLAETMIKNREIAGRPYDLFVWDNASTDERVGNLLLKMERDTYIKKLWFNPYNVGIAKAFNEMLAYVRNSYDAFVFMANDILEPVDWLADRVKYLDVFSNSGMISQSPHQVRPNYPAHRFPARKDLLIYPGDVIGQFMISKQVLDKVGAFRDDWGEYAPIDNDYNYRCSRAGFVNYYIPGMAVHLDEAEPTNYGYDKQQRISETWAMHVAGLSQYNDPANIYKPLPGELTHNMRDHV